MTIPSNQTNEEISRKLYEGSMVYIRVGTEWEDLPPIIKQEWLGIGNVALKIIDSRDSLHQEQLGEKDAEIQRLKKSMADLVEATEASDNRQAAYEQLRDKTIQELEKELAAWSTFESDPHIKPILNKYRELEKELAAEKVAYSFIMREVNRLTEELSLLKSHATAEVEEVAKEIVRCHYEEILIPGGLNATSLIEEIKYVLSSIHHRYRTELEKVKDLVFKMRTVAIPMKDQCPDVSDPKKIQEAFGQVSSIGYNALTTIHKLLEGK